MPFEIRVGARRTDAWGYAGAVRWTRTGDGERAARRRVRLAIVPDDHEPLTASAGLLHHIELWVPDLARAEHSWGWLLTALGCRPYQSWEHGRSWRIGGVHVVLEESPDLIGRRHERRAPGLNHLAFSVPGHFLDALVQQAPRHGWRLLFPDRHPYAGGPEHRAAYLEDADGFEVELVATG